MQSEVKAIIFDFDGLMLDTEKISMRGWAEIEKKYGITIDNTFYSLVRGTNYSGGKKIFLELYGKDMPYDKIKAEKQAYFNEDVEKNGIDKKPGLDELLEYIDRHDIKKAIASGSKAEYVRKCSGIAGIRSDFDIIIGGDMVKRGKPDPEVFIKAAQQLDVPAKNCLVLEDSINGAEAALRGGFQIIIVPDSVRPPDELVRRVNGVYDTLLGVIGYLGNT